MQFAFETDADTIKLLEIAVEALTRYFGYSEAAAVGLVNEYYLHNPHRSDDHWCHHEGAYGTAARVHYFESLKGDSVGFDDWRRKEGHWGTPPEFLEYFRDHYFENDRPLIAELWKPKPR